MKSISVYVIGFPSTSVVGRIFPFSFSLPRFIIKDPTLISARVMRRGAILHNLLYSLSKMFSSILRNLTLIVLALHHTVVLQTLLIKLHCSLQIWRKSLLGVFPQRMLRTRTQIFGGASVNSLPSSSACLLRFVIFFEIFFVF